MKNQLPYRLLPDAVDIHEQFLAAERYAPADLTTARTLRLRPPVIVVAHNYTVSRGVQHGLSNPRGTLT